MKRIFNAASTNELSPVGKGNNFHGLKNIKRNQSFESSYTNFDEQTDNSTVAHLVFKWHSYFLMILVFSSSLFTNFPGVFLFSSRFFQGSSVFCTGFLLFTFSVFLFSSTNLISLITSLTTGIQYILKKVMGYWSDSHGRLCMTAITVYYFVKKSKIFCDSSWFLLWYFSFPSSVEKVFW